MVNSFETWEDINEGTGSTSSKQVYIAPNGHKFKVVIKIQSKAKFMVKAVREMQLLDTNSDMTNLGAKALKQYLNSQRGFVNTFGKIDGSFFGTKFIIYAVVKDTAKVEKIQFTIADRSEIEGLESNIQFVSTKSLNSIQNKTEALTGIIRDTETTAKNDTVEGTTEQAVDASTDDAKGSSATKVALGSRFRYTMRTNGLTYFCEIDDIDGHIDMEPISSSKGPKGAISWENPKVLWFTDWDDANKVSSTPLYMDTEITNDSDVEFFSRMFTDAEFVKETIKKYEDEYGSSEITADNLRDMLYYGSGDKKGTPIFKIESNSGDIGVNGTSSVGKSTTDLII